jgi:hypothetical protein
MYEYRATVKTLMIKVNSEWSSRSYEEPSFLFLTLLHLRFSEWRQEWRRENPSYVANDNLLAFVTDDDIGYNMCHFWTSE